MKLPDQTSTSSVFRNRNFILLLFAYGISAFGDHLSEMGIMKAMNVETGDEKTRIGALMLFCFFAPYVVFGPLAGVVADRLPRRLVMIATDLLRGLIAFSIPAYLASMQDSSSKLMLLPIACLGLFACFFSPARLSFVPQVVEKKHLTRANSLLNGLAPIAAIVSFVIGGWLAGRGWLKANFFGDSATFVLSAILVFCITLPHDKSPRAVSKRRVTKEIAMGFSYIAQHRHVWQLMIFTTLFWTAAGAFKSILPAVVFDWYGMSYSQLGFFQASLGVGMLLGAAILTWVGDASRAHYNIIVALLGAGLAMLLFSITDWPLLGGILGVGVGLFGVWIIISANTLLQRIVPDRKRGRVFGIIDLSNMSGMVLATGVLGVLHIPNLDELVGWVLRGVAIVLLVVGIVVWRHHAARSKNPAIIAFLASINEVACKFWYRLRRIGPCTVPQEGACIITANHISSADPSFLSAASPRRMFGFMIAREYCNIPVWRHLIRWLECIPVRRDGGDIAATKEALRQIRRGKALGIFMQGGIQTPSEPLKLRDGVAVLAMRTRAMVIPVHLSGARYLDSIIKTYVLRHNVRVRFGPPVDLSAFTDCRDREQVTGATNKIWQAIQDLAPQNESTND